jgi:hypothetical protein
MNPNTTNTNTNNVAVEAAQNKKIKKKQVKPAKKLIELVIEEETNAFVSQLRRKDVLANMLLNIALGGSIMFTLLMTDNNSDPSDSRQGFLFETICEILVILKCIPGIDYSNILSGKVDVFASLNKVTNIKTILTNKIHQGNNVSDITIEDEDTIIGFSCKYNKQEKISVKSTDISSLDATLKSNTDNYKVGLFVKDKQAISKSIKPDIHNNVFEKVLKDNLLFDEKDIIKALDVFCYRYKDVKMSVDDFIEQKINAELLHSPRKQLVEKLHQRMTRLKFERSIAKNSRKLWVFSQKPRSGKSISILLICKDLLEKMGEYNKILVMTSVPATINSFIKDLENYIDFKDINYLQTDDLDDALNPTFRGLVFCSVQYLKTDLKGTKKEFLKNMGFDAIVIDESHQGSSTVKTQKGILEVDADRDIEDICKTIKLNIFASGTATKTKKYYRISDAFTYEWEIEDEGHMKELLKPELTFEERNTIIQYMNLRHGPTFLECLQNNTLDQDYSNHPAQVLMKFAIPQSLKDDIIKYNAEHKTNFGFSFTSLFALKQSINNSNGEAFYEEEFDICKYGQDGIDILKGLLELIISKNQMKNDTIMKQIEATQASFNSRQSTVSYPLMFIMYLPTHTRNNTIALLQKTLKAFLEEHKLWCDYNVEYSNSLEDSSEIKEDYNSSIDTKMKKTRELKKRGCILLLGDKGSVGITYNECDVTISLDDGHNLDNYKQRVSRSLTPSLPGAPKKTLGIAVDLNIQRTYLYLNDMIHRHRRNTKTVKTNAEILQYYFEHKIFLFDPQQINNGKLTRAQITSFYEQEANNIMKEIDDTLILEQIVCDDDLRFAIKMDFQTSISASKKANSELEGLQQDCPKGESEKIQIDSPKNLDAKDLGSEEESCETLTKEDEEKIEQITNQTYEMCKTFLFPLLALISRSYKIFNFKEIFTHPVTKELIVSLLRDKKIELNRENYSIINIIMNKIMDNNDEIVNNIREIYSVASYDKLQYLIAKHFIPTSDEKKMNAEVPTPVTLVKEMVETVPATFWSTPRAVFEPCCGKGNFVLEIVRKFNDGLLELYPDNEVRAKIIMTKCIYYSDITALNVFITTQLLRCEYESICGQSSDDIDFAFNSYTGDTLLIDIAATFGQDKFDAVIGNPPYNDASGNKGKGHTLWTVFIERSLQKWLNVNGYLLFVNPSLWRQPEHPLQNLMKSKQIIYLEIHDEKDGLKTFGCNTRYDVYLIQNLSYEKNTIIKTQKGEIESIDLREWVFIPNYDFDIIGKIITGNEKINILHSESKYEVRRPHMGHNETEIFKYPCIYSVNRSNELSFKWSNTKDKGMFDIPKVIFGSGATGFIIDKEGKYGLTQWATGIVDDVENLESIKNVLNSAKFKDIILATSVSKAEINRKILKYFRKDFWKEFISKPANKNIEFIIDEEDDDM